MTIRRLLRALTALACLVNLGLWLVYGTGPKPKPHEITQALTPHLPAPLPRLPTPAPAPPSAPMEGGDLSGPARVVDGDTIKIKGQSIRLTGMDAPESKQICKLGRRNWACGETARDMLRTIIGQQTVSCAISERDKYGRALALCRAGGVDIAKEMVSRGMALAYSRYTDRYVTDEVEARNAKRGIWKAKFTPPEQWRREQKH